MTFKSIRIFLALSALFAFGATAYATDPEVYDPNLVIKCRYFKKDDPNLPDGKALIFEDYPDAIVRTCEPQQLPNSIHVTVSPIRKDELSTCFYDVNYLQAYNGRDRLPEFTVSPKKNFHIWERFMTLRTLPVKTCPGYKDLTDKQFYTTLRVDERTFLRIVDYWEREFYSTRSNDPDFWSNRFLGSVYENYENFMRLSQRQNADLRLEVGRRFDSNILWLSVFDKKTGDSYSLDLFEFLGQPIIVGSSAPW